jgi:hypothetical protein
MNQIQIDILWIFILSCLGMGFLIAFALLIDRPKLKRQGEIHRARMLRASHGLLILLGSSLNQERAFWARQRLSLLYSLERKHRLGPFSIQEMLCMDSQKGKRIRIERGL